MSQQNVELVVTLMPAPDADIAALFRDDEMWAAVVDANHELVRSIYADRERGDCSVRRVGIPRD